MKSSYLVFIRNIGKSGTPGRTQQLQAVKYEDRSAAKIGELLQTGWRFHAAVGHLQGKPTAEKLMQIIYRRNNWAEYCRQRMPLPFTEQEIAQMRSNAGYRGGAYELMMQLRMEREIGSKKNPKIHPLQDPAIEAIFNVDVKPAMNELSLKEAAVVILNYGLMDGNQIRISQLSNMFGLTRGSIERIIKEAIAIMFGSISSSKVRGDC